MHAGLAVRHGETARGLGESPQRPHKCTQHSQARASRLPARPFRPERSDVLLARSPVPQLPHPSPAFWTLCNFAGIVRLQFSRATPCACAYLLYAQVATPVTGLTVRMS